MNPIFKKLNFKDHTTILCMNHPDTFDKVLYDMDHWSKIHLDPTKLPAIEFVIIFGTKLNEVEAYTHQVGPKLTEDAVFWFCYPKKSSKKYTCEFNRDTGWQVMGEFGLEGVRQVAIDEDWSAIRFRNVKKIKKMTRRTLRALSAEGKKRTDQL